LEKMIVTVFETEANAYDGMLALGQLDREGTISVHAGAVVKKNIDGTVTLLKGDDEFPIGALGGTAIGSLIGLLGGPIGVVVGATSGTLVGAFGDLYESGVSAEFVDDVSVLLEPGKYAVIADVSEEWITPLDLKMAALGGEVLRTTRSDVEIEQMRSDVAALDWEITELETEMKNANNERKAELKTKIDKLKAKRQQKIDQAKQRLEQTKKEHSAKVQNLKEKAAKAHDEKKATIEARINQINDNYEQKIAKWKNSMADKIEEKAQKLRS
jgi:uncharacterized membrane protein